MPVCLRKVAWLKRGDASVPWKNAWGFQRDPWVLQEGACVPQRDACVVSPRKYFIAVCRCLGPARIFLGAPWRHLGAHS